MTFDPRFFDSCAVKGHTRGDPRNETTTTSDDNRKQKNGARAGIRCAGVSLMHRAAAALQVIVEATTGY